MKNRLKYFLRIPDHKIAVCANAYPADADECIAPYASDAKHRGYLTTEELYAICRWKSPRKAELAKHNPVDAVRELTRFAFSTNSQWASMAALLGLAGVQIPTASVILHFCCDARFPILDWRALKSLGIKKAPPYTIAFWLEYVAVCRREAQRLGISVRTLDKALWVYGGRKAKFVAVQKAAAVDAQRKRTYSSKGG